MNLIQLKSQLTMEQVATCRLDTSDLASTFDLSTLPVCVTEKVCGACAYSRKNECANISEIVEYRGEVRHF